MKYLRDIKGGPMAKLWSHLLKVIKQCHCPMSYDKKTFFPDICDAFGFEDGCPLLEQCEDTDLLHPGIGQPSDRAEKQLDS